MLWNLVVWFILIIGGGGAEGTILFYNKLINWPRREKIFWNSKVWTVHEREISISLWSGSDMKQKIYYH
jgi:hypothetical protein